MRTDSSKTLLYMAVPQMDALRHMVQSQLGATVDKWHYDLQTRWGDPRVYELQQQAIAQQENALAHDLSKRTETSREQYETQRKTIKERHTARLDELSRSSGIRLGSSAAQTRKKQPRPLLRRATTQARPRPSEADPQR